MVLLAGEESHLGDRIVVLWIPKVTFGEVFLACVLHALGSNPAGVRVFRNCASKGHLPLVKVTFAEFFWLVFCMPWAGILLAFKCFGTVPPRDICQWFC